MPEPLPNAGSTDRSAAPNADTGVDGVLLVAIARHALDRAAVATVRECLDRLSGLFASDRSRGAPDQRPPVVAGNIAPPSGAAKGGLAPWQLRHVCDLIEDELGTKVTVETMAAITALSPAHFCRAFKSSTGHTPHAYLMRRRLFRAQALMLHTDDRLSEIACACGLADQSHLARLFRRTFGQTPRTWRRLSRRLDAPNRSTPAANFSIPSNNVA
jgi:transcriptional regulator GlxA family with amidase domain